MGCAKTDANKCAVITGANGFVGSALSKTLVRHGWHVYAVVRDGTKLRHFLKDMPRMHVVECDMSHYTDLPCLLPSGSYDAFYHFAWAGTSGEQRKDENIQLANVKYSCEAVRAASAIDAKRFIYAGSIMEYELAATIEKNCKTNISSQYSAAKMCADYMCNILAEDLGIACVTGIISNIYGPGEFSPRFINNVLRRLLRGEQVSFSAGEQLYDFIYIDDAAEMFALIGESGQAGVKYYIGNPKQRQLRMYIEEIGEITGQQDKIGLGEMPMPGISLTYNEFDTSRVAREFNYDAKVDFRDGIISTIAWLKEEMQYGR